MDGNKKYGFWWLRSPGFNVNYASLVFYIGTLGDDIVINGAVGLRPAFRLNLESLLFTSPAKDGKAVGVNAELKKQAYDGTYRHAPTSRDFTEHKLTLVMGYDKKLTASFAPNGAQEEISWSSDTPAVATVDAATGVVNALGVGSATITATAKTSNKTAECAVTVTEGQQTPGLILTPTAMTVSRGITEKITASFSGVRERPLVWKSSDEKIATVDKEGKVTALSEGSCTITVTTEDGAYNAACEIKVIKETTVHSKGGSSGGCSSVPFAPLALLLLFPCLQKAQRQELIFQPPPLDKMSAVDS